MSKWKKYAEDEYMLDDDKYSYTKLWKIGLSSNEIKRRGIGLYAVSSRIGRDGNEFKKYFKTRKSAVEQLKKIIKGEI